PTRRSRPCIHTGARASHAASPTTNARGSSPSTSSHRIPIMIAPHRRTPMSRNRAMGCTLHGSLTSGWAGARRILSQVADLRRDSLGWLRFRSGSI
ncbi:MAG: hypothetical protein H0U76_14345, partial [Ktedonobacteraceae bacterium]|nr:hypothetical protein [Ktedonobacteraceae bacterium]